MSVLFRNASVLRGGLELGAEGPLDVLIEGSRIDAVAPALAAPAGARIVDATGKLLMPGLINGHFHSPVNHLKGYLDGLPLELFMLYESPPVDAVRPTPREAYVRTQLACAEMLRTGVTSVQDDAFFLPEPSPEIIDAVMQAYADSGIRASVALDEPELSELEKLPFLADLVQGDLRAELSARRDTGALLEAYGHLITRWHGAAEGRLRAAVSCSAPQRVSPEYLLQLDELSQTHGLSFFAHMLETKLQRVFGTERLGGRSLVRYAADLGVLSPRLNIIHAIWVDDADLDAIAASGAVIAHNPVCNLRLGSGIMPFRRIRDRGIPICLGSDEAVADDSVNMWAVAKTTGLIHNITDPDYRVWPRADEILRCLTTGGAQAMGLGEELGAIEPGRLADLILLDLDTLAFTPLNDLPRQLVYCESGSSVVATMAAGRLVYENGHCTQIDEPALRAEACEIFARKRAVLGEVAERSARLRPYYEAMYAKAATRDVGMNRWATEAAA